MSQTKFQPVRGLEETILNLPRRDGYIYVATDTKKIYIDTSTDNKLPIGGAGNSGIYYGLREVSEEEAELTTIQFTLADIEGEEFPTVDDLILNAPDGCFYRVRSVVNSVINADRLTVAGNGSGGGGGYAQPMTVTGTTPDSSVFIYGQESSLTITPLAARDKDDNPADNFLQLTWTIRSRDNSEQYQTGNIDVQHGVPLNFEFGSKLYEGWNYIEFSLIGANSGEMKKPITTTVQCVKILLKQHVEFTSSTLYNSANNLIMKCTVEGTGINKILEYWFDDVRVKSENITDTQPTRSFNISTSSFSPLLSHGRHNVEFRLFQMKPDGTKGTEVPSLKFEIAYAVAGDNKPIIWLGEYQSEYTNYDKIIIPYLVYDPARQITTVRFYNNGTEMSISPMQVEYSAEAVSGFYELEIIDAVAPAADQIGAVARNDYQITCGETARDITFNVRQTGKMILAQQESLLVNFDAAGRSNKESIFTRPTWTYDSGTEVYNGIFENFNWYNNGWIVDSNGNTCLRISNGARFSIPIGTTSFNGSAQGSQSHTFEFEFKIRNVQNYEHLIKLITRYKNDDDLWAAYQAVRVNWDSYDQFLNDYLIRYEIPNPNGGGRLTYDDLEYDTVKSEISEQTALCNYYDAVNGYGFCLGTQDAFFKTNQSTLNVNYVEDKIINLALVFSKTEKLVSIYLNGALSGAAYIPDSTGPFTVSNTNIVFNSEFCDIDLYKFRHYSSAFAIGEVLNNYAVDLRDPDMYEQSTSLSTWNGTIREYQLDYTQMLNYNNAHPDKYLMPYLVFTSKDSRDALPSYKLDERKFDMLFVNTGLDRAYQTGELAELAKNYSTANQLIGYVKAEDLLAITASRNIADNYYYVDPESQENINFDFNLVHYSAAEGDIKEIKVAAKGDWAVPVYRILNKVENYYLHHGASFVANNVPMKTQGTSSQFYPRRNYKAKCKGLMFANRGPFEEQPMHMQYFFMDNDTVGTTKFTLKIDYMESSGTYNTGLANLVANAYTKHPLNDYSSMIADMPDLSGHRTSVQGFPAMTFHKKLDNSYTYIGRYNINLDKGSDEMFGFKLFKNNDPNGSKLKITINGESKKVADAAECWEFSDNNRGYCSFRDPLNREQLSFSMPAELGNPVDQAAGYHTNAAGSCPAVADSFEYRYHVDGDLFDYLYLPSDPGITEDDKADLIATYGDIDDVTWRGTYLLDKMSNWERACQWVWSTCTDNVDSDNDIYAAYAVAHNKVYSGTTTRQVAGTDTYIDCLKFDEHLATMTAEDVHTDIIANYGVTEAMLNSAIYGSKDEEHSTQTVTVYTYTNDDLFNAYAKVTGYTYQSYSLDNGVAIATFLISDIEERATIIATIENNPASYETARIKALRSNGVLSPVTYGSTKYIFDTKEYRLAKFKNEFTLHFDKEYSIVYFIITELFMCYDSRGKNCMMASWGPHEPGGDYIWYPIFYDLDTQLGINNTGIPSFEYFVNATEDGCFSTNDSVLWGNIYRCFLDDIKTKYQALRTTIVNRNDPLSINRAPIAGIEYSGQSPVEHIENWYRTNPQTCNSMCMRGQRPLVAINYDEYYKYISIMNSYGPGYQGTDSEGTAVWDIGGNFLYALQGDRSLSRQQFLSRRINFIDSWLTQGNYKEGSGKTIKFRTSANDPATTSDKWVDNNSNKNAAGEVVEGLIAEEGSYYEADGVTKKHELDADFYINLSPFQRSYVTLATDNAPLPSIEYEGTPVKMMFPSNVVTGIKKSPQYAEQLLYVYGADYLKDIGDVSLLYPREFELTNATHLQRIILGNDTEGYKNLKLKSPKFDAAKPVGGTGGKPLLKEVVFTNVRTDSDTNQTFDFSSAEKLQVFRALGMNLANIVFAEGVALHTLHLPATITELVLKEARNLTDGLITSYVTPTRDNVGNWQAQRGLYIQNLTDKDSVANGMTSSIAKLDIAGGNFGYDTYTLLKKLYEIKKSDSSNLKISLTDVKWSPYIQLEKGYEYVSADANKYYIDNEHYQLVPYTYSESNWEQNLKNGLLYYKDTSMDETIIDSDDMFEDLAIQAQFMNPDDINNAIPRITGSIYINNASNDLIEESYIRNTLMGQYFGDNFKVFVKNVKKAYSAKFVKVEDDGSLTVIGTQKVKDDENKIWFTSPYIAYADLTHKDNYDFYGWSTVQNDESGIIPEENWSSLDFVDGQYEYVYYIIYKKHPYAIKFYNDDNTLLTTKYVDYNDFLSDPLLVPSSTLEQNLDLYRCYKFNGWNLDANANNGLVLEDIKSTKDMNFYAIYEEASVFDNVLSNKYLKFNLVSINGNSSYTVGVKDGVTLRGKITLPLVYNNLPITAIAPYGFVGQKLITHVFFDQNVESQLTKIDNYAFSSNSTGQYNLNDPQPMELIFVDFPETVVYLGSRSFFNCARLLRGDLDGFMQRIMFQNIEVIGEYCFQYCSSITGTLNISYKTIEIADVAFGGASGISQVIFGSSSNASQLGSIIKYNIGVGTRIFNGLSGNTQIIANLNSIDEASEEYIRWTGYNSSGTWNTSNSLQAELVAIEGD